MNYSYYFLKTIKVNLINSMKLTTCLYIASLLSIISVIVKWCIKDVFNEIVGCRSSKCSWWNTLSFSPTPSSYQGRGSIVRNRLIPWIVMDNNLKNALQCVFNFKSCILFKLKCSKHTFEIIVQKYAYKYDLHNKDLLNCKLIRRKYVPTVCY